MSRSDRKKKVKRQLNVTRIVIVALLTLTFIIAGAGLGFVAGALKNLPNIESGGLDELAVSSYIFDRHGDLADTLHGVENRTLVSLDDISQHMQDALLAIEDQRFYRHSGIDFYRLAGAFVSNIKSGRIVAGGSTITQQLVGLAMLDRTEKTYTRKIQEAVIAIKVENDYTKDELLEFYLNRVYFGHGAYGVEAAAKKFFDKSSAELTIEEAALLAGVIQNPSRHSPFNNPDNALNRRSLVLNALVDFKKLTKVEAEELKKIPLNIKEGLLEETKYKYQSYVDHVIEEAIKKLELTDQETSRLFTEGFRIYTTLDPDIQSEMEKVYADPTKFPKGRADRIIQSAMVVIDNQSGGISGLIGGRDQVGRRQFNRATQALRQPGSVIKPIAVYGPALEMGYTPATILDDYPQSYQTPAGTWTPKNYDNRYRGLVSMRTAIQHSINTAAVKMLDQIGVATGFKFCENLGVTTLVESGPKNDMGLSLALGGLTKGMSVLELTGAYMTFPNQGIYIEPYAVTKIEDRQGNLLWEHKVQKRVVMDPKTAYQMNSMLQTVVTSGTATRAQMGNRPVAGKTGTTSNTIDAWFVGYTADYVGAVWLGYDQEDAMTGVFGGANGGPIWRQVMEVAHKNLPIKDFVRPDGIVSQEVDSKSGLLPSELTPQDMIRSEIFNNEFTPQEISNVWVQAAVCPDTGQLITNNCPRTPIVGTFLKRTTPWNPNILPDGFKHIVPEDAHLELPSEHCTLHGALASTLRLQGQAIMHDNSNMIKAAQLTWTWDMANENTIYNIYRSDTKNFIPNANNRLAVIEEPNVQSYLDETVKPGVEYYYRVIAIDKSSNIQSPASDAVLVPKKEQQGDRAMKPPKLQGRLDPNGELAIELSWSRPNENGNFIYYIFRSEEAEFEPGAHNQIAQHELISNNSFLDKSIHNDKSYYYRVIGLDTELNRQSPVSNELRIIVP